MDNMQIFSILKDTIGKGCLGVFPSDRIPSDFVEPCAIVVNLDPSTKPGSHWVAIFVINNTVDYFDSYGQPPNVRAINNFLKKFKGCNFNRKRLQGPFSSVCGHYYIYFAVQRWKGVPMDCILNKFSENLEDNDEMVTEWINSNFHVDTSTYDTELLLNKICCSLETCNQ